MKHRTAIALAAASTAAFLLTLTGCSGSTSSTASTSATVSTEWLEVPVGVVAQIQGHKPSATAE